MVYVADFDHQNRWGINGHCLIRDENGTIHFFGIEYPFLTATQGLEQMKGLDNMKNVLFLL